MNPLNAAISMKEFVVNRITKRTALKAIQSAPLAFSHIPAEGLQYRAALYFADPLVNIYQIRQWYEPMRRLAEQAPVVVIVKNPATALQLREECPLPLFFGPTIASIEEMLETQEVDAVFYVNQNIRNFQMMRFNHPAHIFISHGESEKAYMWSNQLKAYDYVFSAGQAARDRLEKNLTRFNAHERTRLIGRPQIDVDYTAAIQIDNDFKTVLYAPTWEGDRPSMRYGSLSSHGTKMIEALILDGKYNIIFRPHPRSGINDLEYKADLDEIRTMLDQAGSPGSPTYFYDDSDSWGWQWHAADICVADMSAVAYDWMATGKPLMITRPSNPNARIDDSPALLKMPQLLATEAEQTADKLLETLLRPEQEIQEMVDYYFGDMTSGASMRRFISESLSIINQT